MFQSLISADRSLVLSVMAAITVGIAYVSIAFHLLRMRPRPIRVRSSAFYSANTFSPHDNTSSSIEN